MKSLLHRKEQAQSIASQKKKIKIKNKKGRQGAEYVFETKLQNRRRWGAWLDCTLT